jgi:hypothetical protein
MDEIEASIAMRSDLGKTAFMGRFAGPETHFWN